MSDRKRNQQLRNISTATMLEEAEPPRFLYVTATTISIILGLLIIWSIFTDIQEKTVSYGELIPESGVHSIQHLEGGIVDVVHVKNSQIVKKGDKLITLKSKAIDEELGQMRSRQLSLYLDTERLMAYIDWKKPVVGEWVTSVKRDIPHYRSHSDQLTKLVHEELTLLSQQNTYRANQISVIDSQIKQHKEELTKIDGEINSLNQGLSVTKEEMEIYDKLIKEGHISKRDYLQTKRKLIQAEGDLERLHSIKEKETLALEENLNFRIRTISELTEKASQDLDIVNAKSQELKHLISKLEDKLNRSTLYAPSHGTVHNLEIQAGSVIAPGSVMLDVVPEDDNLVAECKINPIDIGHIKVGDEAIIKVLTFDFARYGSVSGIVSQISANAFEDPNTGLLYFKTIMTLNSMHVGEDELKELKPGMSVEANIITGKKSLMSYLLKPIRSATDKSFSER